MAKNVLKNTVKVGIYARVSTVDQQTLPMQIQALKKYAQQRGTTPKTPIFPLT